VPNPSAETAPKSPSDWPVWLAIAFGWALARAPWRVQRALGHLLGRLMQAVMIARRRIAVDNLQRCFPELDAQARADLLRAHFDALGLGVFEFLRAWWGRLPPLERNYTLTGLEQLRAAQAGGRGVILVSPHFTTLEICVRLLSRDVALAGMYRPHDAPALEWAVKRARAHYTLAMYARDELRPVVRHLKSGGVLWFAPDQETRRGESVFVPFFGQSAWSLTSTHQLARLSRAAVLPLFHERLPDGSYRLEIGEPLADFPSADASVDTARIMALMEAQIRRVPAQYLWIHQRFKRQPDAATGADQ
jgi:KDO2-lipid IV(A) lauroyltransferase